MNQIQKKNRMQTAEMILMLSSLPFYWLGYYTLRINENLRLGSLRYWAIGLTGSFGKFAPYLYTKGPNFMNGSVWLLIISVMLILVYTVLQIYKNKLKNDAQRTVLLFCTSFFGACVYAAGLLMTWMFYSNRMHASYARAGFGGPFVGAFIALACQMTAVGMQFPDFFEVVTAYLNRKKEKPSEAAPLPIVNTPQTAVGSRTAPRETMGYYLVGYRGDYSGGKIPLDDNKEVLIGKDPSLCSVVIPARYKRISRKHCGVTRKGYRFYLKDYSTNGTYLSFNQEKIATGGVLTEIKSGERFNLAKTENEFYCQIEPKS